MASRLRGLLGSGCTGGYRVQSRDGAQRGKEGMAGGLAGAPGTFMPSGNRGAGGDNRWYLRVRADWGSEGLGKI